MQLNQLIIKREPHLIQLQELFLIYLMVIYIVQILE